MENNYFLKQKSLVALLCCHFRSVAKSFPSSWPHGLHHVRLPCPSPSPRVCPSSCPLIWWFYLIISSSATLFSFYLHWRNLSRIKLVGKNDFREKMFSSCSLWIEVDGYKEVSWNAKRESSITSSAYYFMLFGN